MSRMYIDIDREKIKGTHFDYDRDIYTIGLVMTADTHLVQIDDNNFEIDDKYNELADAMKIMYRFKWDLGWVIPILSEWYLICTDGDKVDILKTARRKY